MRSGLSIITRLCVFRFSNGPENLRKMERKNVVYIGRSLDGYIAGKNGELDWLETYPNPDNSDMGYGKFMEGIDAIVMGRNTFDVVCGFDIPWPYSKPVFVLSNTLKSIPDEPKADVQILGGPIKNVLATIHAQGYNNLYIDGGKTVHQFLKEDLIDEMIIATLPILLGDGIPLFHQLPKPLHFNFVRTEVHLDQITQTHYTRNRD